MEEPRGWTRADQAVPLARILKQIEYLEPPLPSEFDDAAEVVDEYSDSQYEDTAYDEEV